MKKRIFIIALALAALLCLCFCLAACGANSAVNGTYYLYESEQFEKSDWYELKDGVWTDNDGYEGTYKVVGSKISFYGEANGENVKWATGTVKDGALTMSSIGATHTYRKEVA